MQKSLFLLKNWQYVHKPTKPTTPTIPTNQVNAEIETQLLTEKKQKLENAKSNLKPLTLFYAFHSLTCYVLILLTYNILFHLFFFNLTSRLVIFVFEVLTYYLVNFCVAFRRK